MCQGIYPIKNDDLCLNRGDYVFAAVLVVGIALLALGGLAQSGHIPATGQQLFLGVGSTLFALSALVLLLRGCCAQS